MLQSFRFAHTNAAKPLLTGTKIRIMGNRDRYIKLFIYSRTNITKKIKLLVNPSMASASREAKTGSGVENKRNVSRLPDYTLE